MNDNENQYELEASIAAIMQAHTNLQCGQQQTDLMMSRLPDGDSTPAQVLEEVANLHLYVNDLQAALRRYEAALSC